MTRCSSSLWAAWLITALTLWAMPGHAGTLFESGRLLGTSGVTAIEGAGGGGLASWATITGYGTRDAMGANVHGTAVRLSNFSLYSSGIAAGLYDRLELSYERLWFDTRTTGQALGLGAGYMIHEDVFGAKLRLFGDAVFDQDRVMPQVAAGVQYKINDRSALVRALGARSAQGVDVYVAATKLLLQQSLLLSATLRLTKANQLGILGFGGDRSDSYHPEFEGSAALMLSRHAVFGGEYRTKPNNLGFAREGNAYDLFLAYFLNKNASATLAYVDLGSIATRKHQQGAYLSIQLGF